MKLIKAINAINQMLELCPSCKSDNISNESPPTNVGTLEVTCHDCSHQWVEDEQVKQEEVYKLLVSSGLTKEAQSIQEMPEASYREFIRENFSIASFNQ